MSELPVRWTTLEERDALRAANGGVPGGAPAGGHGLPPEGPHDDSHHDSLDDSHDGAAPDGAGDARLSRRGFLAATGFSMAGALVACGRAPTVHTVPGATAPEDVVAGRSTWYATTCGGCAAGCGLIVRCRDGRPVKVEGNRTTRFREAGVRRRPGDVLGAIRDGSSHPVVDGAVTTWARPTPACGRLERVRAAGGAVRLVTGTLTGPSTLAAVAGFLAAFPGARHVAYDALSSSATLDAHARTRGARVLPRVHLARAAPVHGHAADFLGTWLSPVELPRGWRAGRTLAGTPPRLSHHVQVESVLTLTGSNADRRLRVEAGRWGRSRPTSPRASPRRRASPRPRPRTRCRWTRRRSTPWSRACGPRAAGASSSAGRTTWTCRPASRSRTRPSAPTAPCSTWTRRRSSVAATTRRSPRCSTSSRPARWAPWSWRGATRWPTPPAGRGSPRPCRRWRSASGWPSGPTRRPRRSRCWRPCRTRWKRGTTRSRWPASSR
jgi:hypothetical protein